LYVFKCSMRSCLARPKTLPLSCQKPPFCFFRLALRDKESFPPLFLIPYPRCFFCVENLFGDRSHCFAETLYTAVLTCGCGSIAFPGGLFPPPARPLTKTYMSKDPSHPRIFPMKRANLRLVLLVPSPPVVLPRPSLLQWTGEVIFLI